MSKQKISLASLRKRVKKEQSRGRFRHSLAVSAWAGRLGKKYGWNPIRAKTAGLLHDFAKEWSPKELLRYVKEHHIRIPDLKFILKHSPNMMHGFVSAEIAKRKGWLEDPRDIKAVASHTLGTLDMSKEAKILYISDFSSPDRRYPEAAAIRKIAMRSLEKGFVTTVETKLKYQWLRGKSIHPLAIDVFAQVVGKK